MSGMPGTNSGVLSQMLQQAQPTQPVQITPSKNQTPLTPGGSTNTTGGVYANNSYIPPSTTTPGAGK